MCERFEKIEENNFVKKQKTTVSDEILNSRHEKIQGRVENIHEQETRQEIADFWDLNKNVIENIGLSSSAVFDCLAQHVKQMQVFDSKYSLWDEKIESVTKILTTYQQSEQKRKQAKSNFEAKTISTNLEEYILQEKQTGKTNLQIIEEILVQEGQGTLQVPKNKIAQYQKLLALANYSAATNDKAHINEIINLSETALLDEGSFENIVLSIYEDERISEQAKIQIQQQFNIKPIQTGGDLRNALNHRNQAIQQHEEQQEKLNQEIEQLVSQKESLDKKRNELQTKLEFSTDEKERTQLSQKIQQLEEELQIVKEQQESTNVDFYKLKQKKPVKDIYLRGYKSRLEEGVISIETPLKNGSIRIPIEANDKEIGEIANALFLYQTLQNLGGAKMIFPDEKFGPAHLPSASMIRFSNEILAALSLGHSGAILGKDELNELTLRMKQLQNPGNLNYATSKTDAFKEDLQELDLVEGDILIKHKFLTLLESVSIHKKNTSLQLLWSE